MKTRTLAAAALVATLAACSAEFSPVAIFAVCAPPAPDSTTGSCLYPETCDAVLAGTPVLDVTTAQIDFRLPVQVDNTLENNADPANGRINTNDAFIQSFEITYSGASLPAWNVNAAITVPAAGSSGGLLRLIPSQYFPQLVPAGASTLSLVVNVRGHGILTSQDSFTTAWFKVPVEVCAGCLAGAITCTPPAVLASCPSAGAFGASPGQTASLACVTLGQ
jgi:hypothetical protein